MHVTVSAKVNVPVDDGVRGLVTALSRFPSLETVESCEEGERHGPWICFRYGAYWIHPWRELAEFVLSTLAPDLAKLVGDDATVRIQTTPSGQVFGELTVRPGSSDRVEKAIRRIANSSTVSPRHTMACSDGSSGTLPQRC